MILEAFSQYLHHASPELPASQVLSAWLWERLREAPKSPVDKVIHCEVGIARAAKNQPATHPRTIRLPEAAETALKFKGSVRRLQDNGKEVESNDSSAYFFKGNSSSGSRLLNSLYEYSMSYEQLKWSRFVHSVKASDFRLPEP
jgi:hypothetical protein